MQRLLLSVMSVQDAILLMSVQEYSNKQLLALISSVDHISKKARQRLTTVVEDMDRVRR